MIACPKCGANMSVKETRKASYGTRRRRHCDNLKCDHRETTIEVVVNDERLRSISDPVLISRSELERIREILNLAK